MSSFTVAQATGLQAMEIRSLDQVADVYSSADDFTQPVLTGVPSRLKSLGVVSTASTYDRAELLRRREWHWLPTQALPAGGVRVQIDGETWAVIEGSQYTRRVAGVPVYQRAEVVRA